MRKAASDRFKDFEEAQAAQEEDPMKMKYNNASTFN